VIRLLVRTTAICLMFATLLVVVRVIGGLTVRPPGARVLEAYQCSPAPCWHGIRPGETTVVQAESILRGDRTFATEWQHEPSSLFCWRSPSDPTWKGCMPFSSQPFPEDAVGVVGIWPSELSLRLGDAFLLFGDPVSSELCWSLNPPGNVPGPLVTVYLHFKNNITAAAYNAVLPKLPRFDPNMTVFRVSYVRDGTPTSAFPWRGFTEPPTLGCGA
jgi:hypothetical protein